MQLKVINSNSAGNGYILYNDKETLLIECGVMFQQIKEALNFNLKNVVGCLVTHEHGDHAKAMRAVMAAGINVYATQGTFDALNLSKEHRAIVTFEGDEFKVGNFRVRPFKAEHDVREPVGFLIYHPECGKVLFLTDSYFCKKRFVGLNNIIIEANHDLALIQDQVMLRDRIVTSHMSITTCCEMLGANDLSAVQKIILVHLSERNSDSKAFKSKVEAQTGKQVFIATPGLNIPFNKTPF